MILKMIRYAILRWTKNQRQVLVKGESWRVISYFSYAYSDILDHKYNGCVSCLVID